jgi:osmotically-inducible protein OsmY
LALMSIGGAIAALADPVSGRRRRHMLRDRSLAAVRRSARRGAGALRFRAGELRGAARRAAHRSPESPVDDHTLADRVRSEAFRGLPITPHEANVGVVDGIVTLRGELASRTVIEELVERVRTVPGVRGVQSLLHTPGQSPPRVGVA